MQRLLTKQKKYVAVMAIHNIDGTAEPFLIRYPDGVLYRVSSVIKSDDIILNAYKGIFVTRYTVKIGESFAEVFREQGDRWYIKDNVYAEVPDYEFYQYGT